MMQFELNAYRVPTEGDLVRFDILRSEERMRRIAQEYFDAHLGVGEVSIGRYYDEATCVERDGLLVAVYFAERGGKNLVGLFVSMTDAFNFVASKRLNLSKLPIDWVEINRADWEAQKEPDPNP